MKFKHLNIQRARREILGIKSEKPASPGRRTFVKSIGIGALAWNPLINNLQLLNGKELQLVQKKGLLKLLLNDKSVWEISERYFAPGYTLQCVSNTSSYHIQATGLRLKGTLPVFSLEVEINKESDYHTRFVISELDYVWEGSLKQWVENITDNQATCSVNQQLIRLSDSDGIWLRGKHRLTLTPGWELSFASNVPSAIKLAGHNYQTKTINIAPGLPGTSAMPKHSCHIVLPAFNDWLMFIENLQLESYQLKNTGNNTADVSLFVFEQQKVRATIEVRANMQDVCLQNPAQQNSDIPLNRLYYYAEYLNNATTKTYLAGTLPQNGCWMNNQLGSFKLDQNTELPDFEAFGYGNQFHQVILEPRLRAYSPKVKQAFILAATHKDFGQIRINTNTLPASGTNIQDPPQKPVRQNQPQRKSTVTPAQNQRVITPQRVPQNTVRPSPKKQPQIDVQFDRLKFKPKNALAITVLRPEDMLVLEFEFHNFNFTNKGQAPFLELDNAKKPGVMVVNFQTQHTLEEAWFESTPIPDPDNESSGNINLPAKHLRAGKSRLVYELPENHPGFPLTMEALLDWDKFKLRVHPRAWIKLPNLKKIKIPSRLLLDKKTPIKENKNLRYVDTPSTAYGLKLAQHTKSKANNLQVYNANEVARILSPEIAPSVQPAFYAQSIKKISWKVEPIPDLSTSIEAPALLYISPNQTNDFFHKKGIDFRDTQELKIISTQTINASLRVLDPLSTNKGELTELWHTRLGVKLKNGKTSVTALPKFKTIRALWAHDADSDYKIQKERNYPFMASLDANNRQKLVHTTSNYSAGFEPFPVPVNDLMLTSLGAYIDWQAFFDVPTPQDNYLNIIEWEHIATLGRDHYVKIVEEGYLFPFGHRAAVVKITERKFHQQTKAALNRQRMFIVVLEKEVLYARNDPEGKFIEFPFQAVRLETGKTPNIDDPQNSTLITVSSGANKRAVKAGGSGANTTYNFYINVGGQGFPFSIIATDKEGREHRFSMPLAFMENFIARNANLMEDVIEVYQGTTSNNYNDTYNKTKLWGQEVAYAPYLVDGDTKFETESIKFDAQVYPAPNEGDLKFHPKMKEAWVFVQQIDELTGKRDAFTIGLEDDNNAGDVFARVISNSVVDFSGGSDKAGGFLVPNMAVSGLSKLQGPVSGQLGDMKNMLFAPDDFFAELEDLPVAKIFGVINLFDLLFGSSGSPFDLSGSMDGMKNAVSEIREEIDSLKNEILYLENLAEETQQNLESQIADLKQMVKDKANELITSLNDAIPRIPNLKAYLTEEAFYAEYKWQPQLESNNIEIIPSLLNVKVNNPQNALSITTRFEKPFDTTKTASMNGVARFEKFGVDIVPLLAINFNYLEFRTGSSQKTDVKVDIDKNDPIQFKGVLNFVNNLQSIIPSDGFSDSGPYINLKPTGVTAGFDISIPNVEVGICMISNISLGANVTLPFTGAPLTMGFNFCRRENPFLLTISCFGGGGYFMMVTTLHGLQSVEAAFEFGAAMSLNVGVASGGVSAMGGFYYKMELVDGEKTTTLTGYLRLNGHLSILGLISLSLEFYLAFSAVIIEGKVQKLEGLATLKVKVEVLFFSKTVSVTVRRELKGADADPKFVEMIDEDDWQEYCLAFAG